MHLSTPRSHRVGGRRRLVALSICAASLATLTSHGEAQQPELGTLRGYVIETETNTPVRGAAVVLVRLSSFIEGRDSVAADPKTIYTNDQGEYVFQGVAPGRYRLDVSGLGYRSTRVWIDLPNPRLVRRSVALEMEPIKLDPVEIVLSASVPKVVGELIPLATGGAPVLSGTTPIQNPVIFGLDMHVLDAAHLPQSGPFGPADVFRALERFPGVSTRGDFSANLWTRGSPWGMTEILLDGLPLYDPLHLGGAVGSVAADGLKSVALMPGVRPPSAAEGAAGTIALTTRRAQNRSASLGISSLALKSSVEDRLLDDRLGVNVTARRSWWDLFSPPAIMAAPQSRGPIDYHFMDVVGHVDARLGPWACWRAGGLWEEDRLHGDIADVVSASDGRWGNRLGWLKLSRPLRRGSRRSAPRAVSPTASRPVRFPGTTSWARRVLRRSTRPKRPSTTRPSKTSVHGADVSGRLTWDAGVDLIHERPCTARRRCDRRLDCRAFVAPARPRPAAGLDPGHDQRAWESTSPAA